MTPVSRLKLHDSPRRERIDGRDHVELSPTELRGTSVAEGTVGSMNRSGNADESRTQGSRKRFCVCRVSLHSWLVDVCEF